MPELKQIEASIELGTSNTKLKEYGARYSDGHVETFIAVPGTDMPFSIHLTTKNYIAPGISFFVFMDGEYQCNRNKIGLKLPGDGVQPYEYETEFRLRQKEEKTSAGSFVAREWSFTKLNTVAADKAPSLNPDYIRNVGTIEIIAMRCRPVSEDPPPQKATPKAPKVNTAKPPTPQPSKAPSKTPSKPASAGLEDAFGGMFGGVFDGACDNMGLDGANDERPVRGDGRVNPQPPPGSFWDAAQGEFRPKSHLAGGYRAGSHAGTEFAAGGPARAKAFIEEALKEAQDAQLDGAGDWQETHAGAYQEKRQDDFRGDRYFGMTGRDRSDYKQFFKERGDPVSQTPRPVTGVRLMEGYVCRNQAAVEEIKMAPPNARDSARFFATSENKGYYENTPAGLQLFAEDLESMRQVLLEQNKQNPRRDTSEAWHDWQLMEAKLHSMRAERAQGQSQHGHQRANATARPSPQQEACEDVSVLRMELRIASTVYPSLDMDGWLTELSQVEADRKRDPLWADQTYEDESAYLMARREQLLQRNQLLTRGMEALSGTDPRCNSGKLEDRVNRIREEGMANNARMKQLGVRPPTTPKIDNTAHGRHINFQQGYDGAPRRQTGNPATPIQPLGWGNTAAAGNNQDWQPVGTGSRKPGQPTGHGWDIPKQPSIQEHFAGEDLAKANEWNAGGQKTSNGWGAPAADGKQNANAAPGSRAGSNRNVWGGSQRQQDDTGWPKDQPDNNNGWSAQKSASKATSKAGWGREGSNKGGNSAWAAESQRESQKNGGGDDWNDGNAGGGAWGGQSTKSEGKTGGWGNTGQSSKSVARSVARESVASNPKDLVKPYWKDWNKPADQRSGSVANSTKQREVAREAYVYPAAKLAAIPEGKVASATHGIQTGRGAEYNHLCRRPVYIDTMEKPYAVFSFKYRSKEKLKQITGLKVKSVDEDVKAVQKQVQKDKLMQMPKDQLIEQLMKSSASKGSSQKAAPSASGGHDWADKPASNANQWNKKSKTKSAASGGWGDNNGPGNGGGGGGWGESTHSKSKKSEANGGGGGWEGSSHSKSKKSETKGWGADQAGGWTGDVGGGTGWYGQNGLAQNKTKTDTSPTGEYKFDYDAFRAPAAYPGSVDTAGGRQISESVWEGPDGLRYRGSSLIGRASWAGDSVGNSLLRGNQGAGEWAPAGDGVIQPPHSKW